MRDHALKMAGLVLFLFALGCCIGHVAGCRQPEVPETVTETIENAAAVAQYKALLDVCRHRAVDAGSIAVFDKCADDIDAELCRTKSLRCGGGQ